MQNNQIQMSLSCFNIFIWELRSEIPFADLKTNRDHNHNFISSNSPGLDPAGD